jgi:hypothetical protein
MNDDDEDDTIIIFITNHNNKQTSKQIDSNNLQNQPTNNPNPSAQ